MLNTNNMAKKLTTKKCVITRQNRLVYNSPAHIPDIQLCNIFGSSEIRIRTMPTDFTFNKSAMPNSFSVMADRTGLRSISRININYPNSFSQSFVFNKTLQLSESPLMNPFIVFNCCSNSFKVFHDDYIAIIKSFNNSFANVVILQSHKPIPSARNSFKLSLTGSGAFRLKNRNEFIMFDSQMFNTPSKKFAIRSDCNFIDTAVHSKNFEMLVRSPRAFCGECEDKETSVFAVNSQQAFNNLPVKIFQSIIRNLNRNFNSALNSGDAQNIIFKRETSWGVIPNRNSFNKGFSFGFFNHSTSLFNTRDSKLRRQSKTSNLLIDKRMEFYIIPNLHFPSFINTQLNPLLVKFSSFDNQIINFQFYGNASNQHCKYLRNTNYLNLSEGSIPPTIEMVGLLEHD